MYFLLSGRESNRTVCHATLGWLSGWRQKGSKGFRDLIKFAFSNPIPVVDTIKTSCSVYYVSGYYCNITLSSSSSSSPFLRASGFGTAFDPSSSPLSTHIRPLAKPFASARIIRPVPRQTSRTHRHHGPSTCRHICYTVANRFFFFPAHENYVLARTRSGDITAGLEFCKPKMPSHC